MIFPDETVTPEAAAAQLDDIETGEPIVQETTETAEPAGADITGETEQEPTPTVADDTFELKVDGQIVKLSKDELITRAQKAIAAEKRLQEAQKEKSDALRLIQLAKDDPFALIKHLQPTLDEKSLLSKRLAEIMDEELLTPEEKQQRQDMTELQRLRAEKKRQEEEAQAAELQRQAAEEQKKLDVEISEAIIAAGLPKTQAAVKRVAEYMLEAMEAGLKVPVAKIAQQVKADLQAEALELLNQSDEETFANLLGKDLLTKAQKASLKNIKKPGNPVEPSKPKDKAEKPAKTTADEFLRANGIF